MRVRVLLSVVAPMMALVFVGAAKLWQGGFKPDDTAWYTAISHQAWSLAIDQGRADALWSLRGVGGLEESGGEAYWNKPPVAFWIHGGLLYVTGPELWSARVPSLLAGALCAGLVVVLCRSAGARGVGVLAGLVLALTYEFVRHTHALSLDMWMCVFLLVYLCASVRAVVGGGGRGGGGTGVGGWVWWAVGGLGLGYALLTKPFVGLIAVLILGVWIAWIGRARARVYLGLAGGALVGIAFAGIWHVGMTVEHGSAFWEQYLGAEIADRAGGTIGNLNKGAESVWYYAVLLGKTYWPWLPMVVFGVVALVRGRYSGRVGRIVKLGVVWAGVWFVVLSVFPDKRPRYLLVAYPGMALVAAGFLRECAPAWLMIARRALVRWSLVGAAAGCVVVSVLPVRMHGETPEQWGELFGCITEVLAPQTLIRGYEPGADQRTVEDFVVGAGLSGQRQAMLYLEYGVWALLSEEVLVSDPQHVMWYLYHALDSLSAGEGEVEVFRSGDLLVTKLEEGEIVWTPVENEDPGESDVE